MLIDPDPKRVVPMIGAPTITHSIRCSRNVACPSAPKQQNAQKVFSPWICGETSSHPDAQKATRILVEYYYIYMYMYLCECVCVCI